MTKVKEITIKEMALLSGVTIRALQYYDDIGLLNANRTQSGYRVYDQEHALRLQQILLHKSFGMSLDEIGRALDDPQFDTLQSLKAQKLALLKQAENMNAMLKAIDAAMAKLRGDLGIELKVIFEGFDPAVYDEEVAQKWGNTDEYKTSQDRTQSYSEGDWKKIKSDEREIWQEAADTMNNGIASDSDEAWAIVARYREHIDRWFYKTTDQMYAALPDLWESDPRFSENIDKFGAGLTQWFANSIRSKFSAKNPS